MVSLWVCEFAGFSDFAEIWAVFHCILSFFAFACTVLFVDLLLGFGC